jgi:hypothetical protein
MQTPPSESLLSPSLPADHRSFPGDMEAHAQVAVVAVVLLQVEDAEGIHGVTPVLLCWRGLPLPSIGSLSSLSIYFSQLCSGTASDQESKRSC